MSEHPSTTSRDGSGASASLVTRGLALMASPIFAVLGLWTGLVGDLPQMVCHSMPGSSTISGMSVMYFLMSAFHVSPWLMLISGPERSCKKMLALKER